MQSSIVDYISLSSYFLYFGFLAYSFLKNDRSGKPEGMDIYRHVVEKGIQV
jgi:hypothetical protein